jgi:hypothetical protein
MAAPQLTDRDRQVLELAIREDLSPGEMANEVRDLARALGVGELAYYQMLDRILDSEAAAAAYPIQVRMLRSLRDGRIRLTRGWV